MPQGRKIAAFGREYQDLQTRREDATPVPIRSRYRKRRRFCGGKEGVQHVWTFGRLYGVMFGMKAFHSEICSTCGKKRYRDGRELKVGYGV